MKTGNLLPAGVKRAIADASSSNAAMLFGDHSRGMYAIAHPDSDGLRLAAFENGDCILCVSACACDPALFDPETDLKNLGGSLWAAILSADTVPLEQKQTRAWESFLEFFEGLPMLNETPPKEVSEALAESFSKNRDPAKRRM